MYDRRLELKRLANRIIDIDIYESVFEKYDTDKWDKVIENLYEENLRKPNKYNIISINAINFANKIQKELDILVFPVIIRTHAGKWLKLAGAFSWEMYTVNLHKIGGCDRVSEYLKKHNKISITTDWNDIELICESR